MFDWLFQPIPLSRGFLPKIKSATMAGGVIFLVMFLLRPFGSDFGSGGMGEFALVCLGFAFVTFLTTVLHGIFHTHFEKNIEESDWLVWKLILTTLILISMIGVANWLFAHFIFKSSLSLKSFLTWQYMTFIVGLIPTLVGSFLYMKNLLKKYSSGANAINREIHEHQFSNKSNPILISGENRNEELNFKTDELLYLAAANNYVEVHFKNETSIKKALIRSTLKKMEVQLEKHSQFFRCHKTYIVNLNQVEKISGNAQGYKLHLKMSDILIPVSRSLNEEISNRFSR